MAVRIPKFTNLGEESQVRSLVATLRQIREEISRTVIPVEEVRSQEDQKRPLNGGRFRVVRQQAGPSDPGFDPDQENEIHFFVGGKWKRVMLEDL